MMKIKVTHRFKRSFKKYRNKNYPINKIDDCIRAILNDDREFLKHHKSHHLTRQYYELHIDRHLDDNWLLVYSFNKAAEELCLVLVDVGNHDDLKRIVEYRFSI